MTILDELSPGESETMRPESKHCCFGSCVTATRSHSCGTSGALFIFVPNGRAAAQSEIPATPGTQPGPDEIRRHLAENEAQRKEVTGYINQLSIQLHRWQLRLQKLDERKAQLEAELSARVQ